MKPTALMCALISSLLLSSAHADVIADLLSACDEDRWSECKELFFKIKDETIDEKKKAAEVIEKKCTHEKNASACLMSALVYSGDLEFYGPSFKDKEKYLYFSNLNCEFGDPTGCEGLAFSYKSGLDVGYVDYQESMRFYTRGCELGSAYSCFMLSFFYEKGQGVERDIQEQVKRIQVACDMHYADACRKLGDIFFFGQDIKKDHVRSAQYYARACESPYRGAPEGCFSLAWMYYEGYGVPLDLPKANALAQRACDAGESRACSHFGLLPGAWERHLRDQRSAPPY